MKQQPSNRAKSIFLDAVELQDDDQRDAFAAAECADNVALRQEVKRLLHIHGELGEFMESAATDTPDIDQLPEVSPGTQIGRYKLLEQIGEGGMGVVYMAEQDEPIRRKVALKIIKPGMDSKQVVARFASECQALAMMDHPNIAKVHDAGSTESGRPYFIMELVKGIPITQFCDRHQLDTRQRLELFVNVCGAIQHAHQKGIIHRDLKPNNVMVEWHDVTAVAKVIDFGVAKATDQRLTEQTLFTNYAQMIGTPLYMSPEQAQLSGLDVDTRSDIYSLGVLLYETLTGTTPFDQETMREAGYDEMRRMIREDEPPKPSDRISTLQAEALSTISEKHGSDLRKLRQLLRGELDWIVMKALEKDRTRRYESASSFANDVQRYLDNESVAACPPSISYRVSKFARRNKVVLTTGVLVAASLIIGIAGSVWQAFEANKARRVADTRLVEVERQWQQAEVARVEENNARLAEAIAKTEVERQLYSADMRAGLADWTLGNVARLSRTLNNHLPDADRDDQRGWEWYYLLSLCHQDKRTLFDHTAPVSSVSWAPDGQYLASTSYDGTAKVWNTGTWEVLRSFSFSAQLKRAISWSPDGRRLAWGSASPDSTVRVWDMGTDQVTSLRGHSASLQDVAWHPNGSRLASSSGDKTIRIWDVDSSECMRVLEGRMGVVQGVAWSPNGDQLASADGREGIQIWDVAEGEVVRGSRNIARDLASVDWSPDGKLLVLGSDSGRILFVNAESLAMERNLHGHSGGARCDLGPDGKQLTSVGDDGLIKVWDAASGECRLTLRGHRSAVWCVCWDPRGRQLATGSYDRTIKIWDADAPRRPRTLEAHPGGVTGITWLNNGKLLGCSSENDGAASVWDATTGGRVAFTNGLGEADVEWSHDGHLLAVINDLDEKTLEIKIVKAESFEEQTTLYPQYLWEVKSHLWNSGLAWSPDKSKLLVMRDGGTLQIWNVDASELLDQSFIKRDLAHGNLTSPALSVVWDFDSRHVAIAGDRKGYAAMRGAVSVIDTIDRQRLWEFEMMYRVTSVAWSPKGDKLLVGTAGGEIAFLETLTGNSLIKNDLHSSAVNSLEWSPDGRRIASVGEDRTVKVLDATTGEELLTLAEQVAHATSVKWSPDGQSLAASSMDGSVIIWDASDGYSFASSKAYRHDREHFHFVKADELFRTSQWEQAIEEYSLCDQLKPLDQTRLRDRGFSYAQLGKWESAVNDIERAVTASGPSARMYQAQLYLQLGDVDGYKRVCAEMLEHFRQPATVGHGATVAWTCALLPDAVESLESCVRLAEAAKDKLSSGNGHYHLVLGAVLFRDGRFEQAVQHLSEAVTSSENEPTSRRYSPAYIRFFLAMANYHLGNREKAFEWFEKATEWTEDRENASALTWNRRLVLRLLQRETQALLHQNAISPASL